MSDTFAGRPKQFLADLTQAMRSAAEAGRTTIVEQARSNAESYLESLRQEAGDKQTAIREAAAEDVAQLRDQSKAQAQLIREESERRVQQRRRTLDESIAEYGRALEAELADVDLRVAAWEQELEKFYEQLHDETDPTMFASLAATMPPAPDFGEPDPSELVRRMQSPKEQSARPRSGPAPAQAQTAAQAPAAAQAAAEAAPASEPAAAAQSGGDELPDHWWLDAQYASHGSAR